VPVSHGAASLPREANCVTERPSMAADFAYLIWYPSRSESSSKRKPATEVAGSILAPYVRPPSFLPRQRNLWVAGLALRLTEEAVEFAAG
jgi:hypothetical protein